MSILMRQSVITNPSYGMCRQISSNSNAKAHPCDGGQCVRFFSFSFEFLANVINKCAPAGKRFGEASLLSEIPHFSHLFISPRRETGRKDGGIYALSFHQAEANGIHDGGCWSGGRRCRCRQDSRHWLQGRFGTFIFDSLSFCWRVDKNCPPEHYPLGGGKVKISQHLPETNTQRSHFPFNDIIG